MTLARRLLRSGAFGVPPTPPSVTVSAFQVMAPSQGGSNPWVVPGQVYHGGYSFLGFVTGTSGSVGIGRWNHSTRVLDSAGGGAPHTSFQIDEHSAPLVNIRSADSHLVAIYAKHNDVPIDRRITSGADGGGTWGTETDLDSQLGATRYTDMQLHELVTDAKHWLLYRDEPVAGTDSRWCLAASSDGCVTFGAGAQLYRVASNRSYVISWSDGLGRIHFIATNGSGTGFTKLGHFYRDADATLHKSDGTLISASLPLGFADITDVYSGSSHVAPFTLSLDGSGHPVFAFTDVIAGDIRVLYARWTGSAWVTTNVCSSGVGYSYNNDGVLQAYGACVDDGAVDDLYVLRDVSASRPELFLYRTADGGATFAQIQQLTTGSTALLRNVLPVRYRQPELRVTFWLGSWTDYTHWYAETWGVGS